MEVDWSRFAEDYDVAVVVLSRDRAEVLARLTDKVVPDYHLFWCGEGYDREYRGAIARHEVPSGVAGLSAVRNYALRQLSQKVVIFIDDDVRSIAYTHSDHYAYLDRAQVQLMLLNLVVNSEDLGAKVFGISEFDIRKATPLYPFRLRAVMGG